MVNKRSRSPALSRSEDGLSHRAGTSSDADDETPRKKIKRKTNDANDDHHDHQVGVEDQEEEDDDEEDEDGHEDNGAMQDPIIAAHEERVSNRLTTCAEAGVIESVTLTDFMCHENLSIDLGPNMNFIIGHNGSGKSAILTAITVCLGGKAASSGRGSSLKNFVRNGRQQATVTIKLKNKGPDAYNHDLYGDFIIIERKFGAEGGGSYIIKGADRQIHARRREDLDAITDHFALAIENPMNVLSQDTARQFLANATPKVLYDLFMKGIELQQLEADHQLLSENIESTKATLVARGRSLEKLREQAEDAEKMYAETHRAREAQDEFDLMKDKMAWVQVRDVEKHRNELVSKVETVQGLIATLEDNLAQNNGKSTALRASIAEVEQQMTNMTTTERKPIEERADKLRAQFDDGRQEIIKLQSDQRECHSVIKRQERTIETTKKEIEDEEKALAENEAGIQQQRMREKRSELDENLGNVREELGDMDAQMNDINVEIGEKKEELDQAEQELGSQERSVDSLNERLDGMRRASKSKITAFNNNMEKLLTQIKDHDRKNRWRQCPIGPMGMTMSLKYPEWSDIVETFWGNRINGFLVNNYEDKKELIRLMNSVGVRACPVLQGNNNAFDIDEPEEKFLTVLRAIEWTDERVKRQLIITNHPESALLIKERREAELTMDPLNPPRNAVRAFAIDSEDPSRGYVIGGGARGSSVQTTTNPYRHPKRLTISSEHDLEQFQIMLTAAQEKARSKKEVCRLLKNALQQLERRKASLYNRRADSQRLQQRLSRELDKLKEELETVQTVDDGKLRGLNDSLQKQTYEAQYQAITTEKASLDTKQKDIKEKLQDINTELEDFDDRLRELEPRLTELTTEIQQLSSDKEHWDTSLQQRKDKLKDYESRLAEAQKVVEDHTSIASQICERVEVDDKDTVGRLQRLLEDKQKAISRIRQRYGGATEVQIAERLAQARENLSIASSEVTELQDLVEDLRTALLTRQIQRKKFQRLICVRAKNNFVRHLSERDFTGKLSFKHDEKELHTHVTPADVQANMKGTGKGKKSTDNKVLSGGEKSFTTICLLLSIWEAMGCPIRALDEFDVFMDSVNRGISMKMMIDSANDSIDKQFIVITPQDMGGVKPTATTRIHKLADPTRGVTRAVEA